MNEPESMSQMLEGQTPQKSDAAPSNLPAPPGTQGKKEPEPPKPEAPTASAPNPPEKKKVKPLTLGLIALGLLAFALLLLAPSPKSQAPTNLENQDQSQLLSEIQTLKIKTTGLKGEIEKLQSEKKSTDELVQALQREIQAVKAIAEDTKTKAQENRNYISTIYRKTIELELRVNAVGGGYQNTTPKEPDGRVVNPYIGSEQLP